MMSATRTKTEKVEPATCRESDGITKAGQSGDTPPRGPSTSRRLELQEEIERALHIRSPHVQVRVRWFPVLLAVLVCMTLVLAAVVWWQLLT